MYDYLTSKYAKVDMQPNIYMMISELQEQVRDLEEKYQGALMDIKRLEGENIETANCLYELGNSIEAVDHRIDILFQGK